MSWHLGPMVALDTETSGVDVECDRIVTACVAVIDGTGQRPPQVSTWLINPGIDIPESAAKIHGISTEHARAHGQDPATAVKEIATRLGEATASGMPIVAYNAVFDLTLLDWEMRRHGIGQVAAEGLRVIDPLVLDKGLDPYRKGKRTLEAACQHYDARIDGAHDASHDALAAARVAWRIAQRNRVVAGMSLDELHAWQVKAKQEQAISLARHFRSKGELDKADTVREEWPIVPYERQEVIA